MKQRFQCGSCGTFFGTSGPLVSCSCVACELARVEQLLASPGWMAVRGPCKGDVPGQTMAQTMANERDELIISLSFGNCPLV